MSEISKTETIIAGASREICDVAIQAFVKYPSGRSVDYIDTIFGDGSAPGFRNPPYFDYAPDIRNLSADAIRDADSVARSKKPADKFVSNMYNAVSEYINGPVADMMKENGDRIARLEVELLDAKRERDEIHHAVMQSWVMAGYVSNKIRCAIDEYSRTPAEDAQYFSDEIRLTMSENDYDLHETVNLIWED